MDTRNDHKSIVIVVGGTHHNTLSIIRSLGMAGYKVDLIHTGEAGGFVTKSRYVNSILEIGDASLLVSVLKNKYASTQRKSIVITCTDSVAHELDTHYDELKDRFFFFNAGENNRVTHFMDKHKQVELASQVGMVVPFSIIYNGEIDTIQYPCLIKPLKSISGGKQIRICNAETELITALGSFQSSNSLLIQQYIQKEYEIVVVGLSLANQCLIPGYVRKHREYDGGTTYSTVYPISKLDNSIVDQCKKFINAVNYKGLFGFEFIYCKGQFFFIEANLRNDATTYALTKAGTNLPAIYVESASNALYDNIDMHISEIGSMVEFNDFKHRKENNVSLAKWLKQYFSARCKYYFDWKDIMPFIYAPFK